ncbi:DUF2232 domain-containing protein [Prosthecomicrobium sp. N25]|uniref:DUF2232 domain-containing protein n=1 Tax=Prosthecomicrobium sp. N25 TaxID=3129254 RepID=UPI003076B7AA
MPFVVSPSAFLMALGSGLASAVLFASLIGGTSLAVPLFALTGLPIAIAALGWGTLAGAIAVVIGGVAITFALSAPAAGSYLLTVAGPVLVLSHLVGLARQDEAGRVEWYPLGRVLAAAAILIAAATVVGGIAIGYDQEATTRQVRDAFAGMMDPARVPGGLEQVRAEVEPFVRLSVRLMPILFPAIWTMILVLNLWLGAKVVAKSDRLARPWEDLSAISLPRGADLGFAGALVLSFLPAPAGLVASPFLGAFLSAYTLMGFAVLHHVTRGSGARPIVLATVYGLVFLFTFPALLVALVGFLERFLRFRDRRRKGGPPGVV